MLYIAPYKTTSRSAKAIKAALGVPFYTGKTKLMQMDTIINWGCSTTSFPFLVANKSQRLRNTKKMVIGGTEIKRVMKEGESALDSLHPERILNHPHYLANAIDKNRFLQLVSIINPLQFTTNIVQAKKWMDNEKGVVVYCRTLTQSREGKGIVVATKTSELVPAKLYTKGVECKREYRVHVFCNNVIDLTAKVKASEGSPNYVKSPDEYIRNYKNGYVFARDAVKIPESVRESMEHLSRQTLTSVNLDFGAVDILRGMDNKLYVLEVNSAPGVEGTTLKAYLSAIANHFSNK